MAEDVRIAARVKAGAAWLDQRDPGWWRADAPTRDDIPEAGPIDLNRLLMRNPCRCVLGYRFGHFGEAPIGISEAVELGFDAWRYDGRPGDVDHDYEALQVEWISLITERREAARGVASDGV